MNIPSTIKVNIESIVALVFSLSPFLQMYIVPGLGTNLEFTLVFFIGGAYATYVCLKRAKCQAKSIVKTIMICMFIYCNLNLLFLVLFQNQHIYNPNTTSFIGIFSNFLILTICVISFKCEKTRCKYFDYVLKISILMSVVVALQTLIYYITGSTITTDRTFLLPFKDFFTKGVVHTQESGLWVFGTLFRPSAFFLEPAHFSQYCSIALAYSLWKNEKLLNWESILITMGIIITTSGLGLLCIILMWGAKLLLNGKLLTKKKLKRIIIAFLFFAVIFGILFVFSDSFQRSVLRIVVASDGYNSAIVGRLWSIEFIENLSGTDLLFGMGYKNIPTYGADELQYYMTGIVELFYCQGILGGCIFVVLYFLMILKTYQHKEFLPFYILIVYLPFLVCSANLVILTLIEYIPFLYIDRKKHLTGLKKM